MANQTLQKYDIELLGERYTIVSDERPELVTQVVEQFNSRLNALQEASGLTDLKKVALLTGLQLAQEMHKLSEDRAMSEDRCNHIVQSISDALYDNL